MLRAALLAAVSVATLLCAEMPLSAATADKAADSPKTGRAAPSTASAKKPEAAPDGRTVRVTITRTVTKDGKTTQTTETVDDPSSIQQVLKGEKPAVVERGETVELAAPPAPLVETLTPASAKSPAVDKTAAIENPVSVPTLAEAAPLATTEAPAAVVETVAPEKPAPVAAPVIVEKSDATESAVPVAKAVADVKPTAIEIPAIAEKPVAVETPAVVTKPVTIEKPVVAAMPALLVAPAAAEKPIATVKPVVAEKPQAKAADKPLPVTRPQLHIVVSIDKQRATLFEDGVAIASTAASTGTASHPTPMGVFTVIQKDKHHVSNLYDASMPFMQRITWSGSALHQGPLPGYPASHGCVRLTTAFAQQLWSKTKLGARIIITKPDVAPVPFEHAKLFIPPSPYTEPEVAVTSGLKTADASGGAAAFDAVSPVTPMFQAAKGKPISVFVSLKERKLYVRQGWQPLFEAPVSFENPGEPIGTHVYTAMGWKNADGAMRWTVVTIPSDTRKLATASVTTGSRKSHGERAKTPELVLPSPSTALDRIVIPAAINARISELMMPGSSLIVSDNPLSEETDKTTDFIVTTR